MNIIVFDTETIGLEKRFVYNLGYVVYNSENHTILARKSFLNKKYWYNVPLMTTAYYAEKKEIYRNLIKQKAIKIGVWQEIMLEMIQDIKDYEVSGLYAFNSKFDIDSIGFTCDYEKSINALDYCEIFDIMGYAFNALKENKKYLQFCEENNCFSTSGLYSLNAETLQKFFSNNIEFVEEHTALSDSEIECNILDCLVNGYNLEYGKNYSKGFMPKGKHKIITLINVDTKKQKTVKILSERKEKNKDTYITKYKDLEN